MVSQPPIGAVTSFQALPSHRYGVDFYAYFAIHYNEIHYSFSVMSKLTLYLIYSFSFFFLLLLFPCEFNAFCKGPIVLCCVVGCVVLRCVALCYVMSCHVMLCYVMLCYVVLCCVMLCIHLLDLFSEIICFWAMLAKFWPSSDHNMIEMVVSDHYLKQYSRNPIRTWCVHLLGECSELICFLDILAKFWPSSGHKMTENGGFRPLSKKVFKESNSNLVCALAGWVFRIDALFGHVGRILALYWPQNDCKWWFPTIFWKSIHTIQFKLGVYTYCVSVQNWFTLGLVGQILAFWWPQNDWNWWFPTIIWKIIDAIQFKLGVNTHCVSGVLKIDSLLSHVSKILTIIWKSTIMWNNDFCFQTWCSHWLEGSLQMNPFFCCMGLI